MVQAADHHRLCGVSVHMAPHEDMCAEVPGSVNVELQLLLHFHVNSSRGLLSITAPAVIVSRRQHSSNTCAGGARASGLI